MSVDLNGGGRPAERGLRSRLGRWQPGAFVVAFGLFIVFNGVVAGVEAEAVLAHGAKALGSVLSVTVHGTEHRRSTRAVIEFEAGAQRIRLEDVRVPPGSGPGPISVYYDTLDPRNASASPPDRFYLLGVYVGVLFVVGGSLLALDGRRPQRGSARSVRSRQR